MASCLPLPSGEYLMWVRPPLAAAPLSQPASAGKGLQIHPEVGLRLSRLLTVKSRQREKRGRQQQPGGGEKRGVRRGSRRRRRWWCSSSFSNRTIEMLMRDTKHQHTLKWLPHVRCVGRNMRTNTVEIQAHTHTHTHLLCLFCKHFRDKTSTKSPGVSLLMFWVWITTADKAEETDRQEIERERSL